MKKGLLFFLSSSILLVGLTSCFSYEPPLTEEEMAARERLITKINDNNSGDFSDRFDLTFPNTYEADIKYTYNDYYDHNYFTIDSTPSKGNVNFLVIPVRLHDYNLKNDDIIKQHIESCYFGDENDLDFESVISYFEKSSYGNLSMGGYMTDWYDSKFDTKINQDDTEKLVVDATNWAKRVYKDLIDFESLDSDKDGYLDAVCLIYNTPNTYRGNDNLWAYSSWVYNLRPNIRNPQPRSFFWASYDFMYENKINTPVDAHTFIHETGHLIGLDDYYDYSKTGYAGASGGAIMQSHNVGDHDPYSKMALGWINPLVVTGESEITIKPFSSSGQVVLLTNRDNFNSPFDEYILIDLYSNDFLNHYDSLQRFGGNNAIMPLLPKESGIRIWHVDGRLARYDISRENYTIVNNISNDGYHYHINANSGSGSHASILEEYRHYRLLQLFQRNLINSFENEKGRFFQSQDMFKEGDLFSINRYKVLMPNGQGKLNDGTSLDYSVEILSISNTEAKIKVRVIE